jgi:hypothetical protein
LGTQGVGILRKTNIKLKGFFSKKEKEQKTTKTTKTMAPLSLQTYFERDTWKSWSNLLNKLENPAFRKVFYPHRIDDLNNVIKRVEEERRNSVKKTNFQETSNKEERTLWQKHTDESVYSPCLATLLNIVHEIRKSDELLNTLFQEIAAMEEKRVYVMHANMLLQLKQASVKEEAETKKKNMAQEKRRATLAEKKTQLPVRRSRRLNKKNEVKWP